MHDGAPRDGQPDKDVERTMMSVIGKTNSMNVDSCRRTRASDSHSAGTVQMSESGSGLASRGSLR